jgi:hypothetical protein
MNEQNNNGKGFLKDKLGDFLVDPPETVWTEISDRLERKSRRKMIIIALSAAATIALAVALWVNFMDRGLRETVEAVQAEQASPGTPGTSTPSEAVVPSEGIAPSESGVPSEGIAPSEAGVPSEGTAPSESIARSEHVLPAESTIRANAPVPDEKTVISDDGRERQDMTALAGAALDAGSFPPAFLEGPVARAIRLPAGTTISPRIPADEDLQLDVFRETDRGGRGPKWMVGAALSPIYSFRDAEEQLMTASAGNESGVIAYAGGIQVSYRTTPRLAIESGILFNKMGIAINAPGIQAFKSSFDFAPLRDEMSSSNVLAVTNSVGNIVSQSGDMYVNSYKASDFIAMNTGMDNFDEEVYADQGIRQNLEYLELPFNLRYSVIDRDLEVQLVGGMSTNFLVSSNVTMPTSEGDREIGYLTNIKTINYSGNAGVGMIYHVKEHLSLRLEPRFRYFINSVNDRTLPSTRPYTFGIYTGLNFLF